MEDGPLPISARRHDLEDGTGGVSRLSTRGMAGKEGAHADVDVRAGRPEKPMAGDKAGGYISFPTEPRKVRLPTHVRTSWYRQFQPKVK